MNYAIYNPPDPIELILSAQGLPGASAYAITVANGYTGTESEWSALVTSIPTSAFTATTQAGIATEAKNDAVAAKDIATTQAGIATTQAGNALSAKNDAVSAKNDAVSAKDEAETQAYDASVYASSALADASTVEALLAAFRSVFLGKFTSDSAAVAFAGSVGVTVVDGVMYDNTTSHKFRIYNGTSWVDYDSSAQTSQSAAALSALSAAGSADIATTQSGIATTQAGLSATAKDTATTQAVIATTQAGNASASAISIKRRYNYLITR